MPSYSLKQPVINGRPAAVWYICWTEARRSRRVSTGEADRRAAERFLAKFVAGKNAPPEHFTCSDLSTAYLAERKEAGVKYPKALANCLRHTDAFFGAYSPADVTPLAQRSYIAHRRKAGVKNSTIDKEMRIFSQSLKFGERESWIDRAPQIKTPGAGAARQRFLSRSEFAAIYFHASPLHLRTFLALAIDTLARGKHILALTWDRVDFERGIVWYEPHDPRSKKRTQAIPMTDRLRKALEKAQEAALSPYVIEWQGKRVLSVRKAYERAVGLAGIEDAHRHDLRRSGASWAVQGGQSFGVVATLLGDSVETTQKTYAIFSPTYLQDAVDSIASGAGGRR